MARVTVEDCLEHLDSRFALVHLSSQRVRQLAKGSERLIGSKNKDVVESLREIAAGLVAVQEQVEIQEDEASLKVEIPDVLL